MVTRRAFTLLEIIVVIIVLALLAGLVAPQIFGRVGEARGTTARTQIELLSTALDNYRLDNGSYPTTEQGPRLDSSKVPANWKGPYLRRAVPNDPWGRPYIYKFPGDRSAGTFELSSLGKDGLVGGTGEDSDINN
jgi:general secretion pathway protein G